MVGPDHSTPSVGKKKRNSGNFNPVLLENMAPGVKQSFSTIEQFKMKQEIKNSKGRKRSTVVDYRDTKNKMKMTEDFSDVYFFSSPLAYFRAVEVAILLNSLYLSVWAVNFISVAEDEAENSVIWQLLMLIPLVVCIPLVGEIVKTASLLSAIAELEVDVIGSVLENMEDEKVLLLELREKISCRLVHVNMQAEKKEIVHALFYEIDTDKSGFISRYEFRDMMRALHLHYSDLKFKKLFNVIDKDRSGSISEQELTDVVFPEEAHDDDFKNRSKIVNEHMEVHKEKKKLESTLAANKGKKSKNWGKISILSKSLGQFKKKASETEALRSSNLLELNTGGGGNDSDSSSSSSSDGSPLKNSAKVGIEVSPFELNEEVKSSKQYFLNTIHSLEEKEAEEKNGCTDRRADFSLQIPLGRSVDDVEEVVSGTAAGRGRANSTRERDSSSDLPLQIETVEEHVVTAVQDF
jgi:hypothetical protein